MTQVNQDFSSRISTVQSIKPAAHTADVDGASADLKGFHRATVVINVGDWTDGTHTFEVQESDDDSTWTAVADADLNGSEPVVDGTADDVTTHEIDYLGDKQFIRLTADVASATNGAEYGGVILRADPRDSDDA